jgi:hypothetical protein
MNDELEKTLQQQLRASEDGLDGPTLARLHAARNRALKAAGNRRESRWPGSLLTAAAAASISLRQPADQNQLAVADLESTLLAAAGSDEIVSALPEEPVSGESNATETLDLLENLDFYEWLSLEESQEQQT